MASPYQPIDLIPHSNGNQVDWSLLLGDRQGGSLGKTTISCRNLDRSI